MTSYYDILDTLETLFKAEEDINTVTTGSIADVANNKSTMYSLAHILINNAQLETSQVRFNITVLCMDVVDISKESTTDILKGNDNEHDVLNTLLAVIARVMNILKMGSSSETYKLDGSPTLEPFVERFEDRVAGWAVTFDLLVLNDMTICS